MLVRSLLLLVGLAFIVGAGVWFLAPADPLPSPLPREGASRVVAPAEADEPEAEPRERDVEAISTDRFRAAPEELRFRLVDAEGRPRELDWELVIRWLPELESNRDAADVEIVPVVAGRAVWRPEEVPSAFQAFASLGLWPLTTPLGHRESPDADGFRRCLSWARPAGFVRAEVEFRMDVFGETIPGPWCREGLADPGSLWRRFGGDLPSVIDVVCDAPPVVTLPLRLANGAYPQGVQGPAVKVQEGEATDIVGLNERGELRFAAERERRLRLSAFRLMRPEFLPYEITVPAQTRDVRLPTVTLPELHLIAQGRVVDGEGRGQAEARVYTRLDDRTFRATSDAQGHYELRSAELLKGEVSVWATKSRWRRAPAQKVRFGGHAPDLVLPESGGLKLSFSDIQLVRKAKLEVVHHERGLLTDEWIARALWPPRLERTIGPLPSGRVNLRFIAPPEPDYVIRDVAIATGKLTEDPRLDKIELQSNLEDLHLVIRDVGGKPASGARATLEVTLENGNRGRPRSQMIDAKGRARFRVPSGARVVLLVNGRRVGFHRIENPHHEQIIQLSPR